MLVGELVRSHEHEQQGVQEGQDLSDQNHGLLMRHAAVGYAPAEKDTHALTRWFFPLRQELQCENHIDCRPEVNAVKVHVEEFFGRFRSFGDHCDVHGGAQDDDGQSNDGISISPDAPEYFDKLIHFLFKL